MGGAGWEPLATAWAPAVVPQLVTERRRSLKGSSDKPSLTWRWKGCHVTKVMLNVNGHTEAGFSLASEAALAEPVMAEMVISQPFRPALTQTLLTG